MSPIRYRQAEKLKMSNENKYKGLTWLSDEGRVHLIYLDRLVETQNIDEVFSLKENSDFSTTLHQIFVIKYDKKPKSLNEPQLNLLLCMHLENAGQSSSILSCLQEWFPEHLDKFVSALSEINAPKCAYAIDKDFTNSANKNTSSFLLPSLSINLHFISIVSFKSRITIILILVFDL